MSRAWNRVRGALLLGWMVALLMLLSGCESSKAIVTNVSEKEANIILVLLESKGIPASKVRVAASGVGAQAAIVMYSIVVPEDEAIEAIAYLNQNGFPREKGTTLLDLFAKQGLMTSGKEETVRYQAGLAQELTNTIMMIDGVIDASVQLSFPPEDQGILLEGQQEKRITAAVYVKHQGMIDDPNLHLESKIKRLVSGSVTGLDINDVTVVSDRSRFTDISLSEIPQALANRPGEYVSIWGVVLSKGSVSRFRLLFFSLTAVALLFLLLLGWMTWKFYPHLKAQGGFKSLFTPIPFISSLHKKSTTSPLSEEEEEEEEQEEE